MVLNELVFFKIEIEDTEGKKDDVALFGQTQGYCWVDGCTINNIKSMRFFFILFFFYKFFI